jgi:hypothetical protein
MYLDQAQSFQGPSKPNSALFCSFGYNLENVNLFFYIYPRNSAREVCMAKKTKIKKQVSSQAAQGLTLGDLLGKKLESVKRESEEKQKKMVKEARNNPAVLKSSEKFSK